MSNDPKDLAEVDAMFEDLRKAGVPNK